MGTSSSSKGPGAGVPMVPPWTPDPPPPAEDDDGPGTSDGEETTTPSTPGNAAIPVAPKGRFRGSRLNLGKFAKTGDRESLKRGLGFYVCSGYGGARTATRRFGGTAQTAEVLYGALSSAGRSAGALPGGDLDAALLAGRSADEVMDAVVEAVRPTDGTRDAEANRAAIKDALSDLLTRFPDASLLELTDEQRLFAVERYVALDVYRTFALDVGKAIQDKASSHRLALARLREVRDYIKEAVAAAFRKGVATATLTRRKIGALTRRALSETFSVFESYLQ